jgi:hypothetical protein
MLTTKQRRHRDTIKTRKWPARCFLSEAECSNPVGTPRAPLVRSVSLIFYKKITCLSYVVIKNDSHFWRVYFWIFRVPLSRSPSNLYALTVGKKKFPRRQKFEGERERGTQSNYKPPKMVILDFNVLVSIFMTTYGRGQNFARIPPFIRKSMKILNIRPWLRPIWGRPQRHILPQIDTWAYMS